jgi:hypothetical protein
VTPLKEAVEGDEGGVKGGHFHQFRSGWLCYFCYFRPQAQRVAPPGIDKLSDGYSAPRVAGLSHGEKKPATRLKRRIHTKYLMADTIAATTKTKAAGG